MKEIKNNEATTEASGLRFHSACVASAYPPIVNKDEWEEENEDDDESGEVSDNDYDKLLRRFPGMTLHQLQEVVNDLKDDIGEDNPVDYLLDGHYTMFRETGRGWSAKTFSSDDLGELIEDLGGINPDEVVLDEIDNDVQVYEHDNLNSPTAKKLDLTVRLTLT
jgi:hypothetical protein